MSTLFDADLEELIETQKEAFRKNIEEFKVVGHRFLNGEISSNEFKASSGGMGVYAQKGGKQFMIRLRVLSGKLEGKHLQLIQEFVKDYNLSSIHLTSREAIQLHDLEFDDLIAIMEKSLEHGLFTRGGGGNFPRNVSLSPLSGVEVGEAFDVTPYALLVNRYFLSRMNQYKLPRKFKVAFSNNEKDSANATIIDLGFLAVNKEGMLQFKLFIGGSLGNQGEIGVPFQELVSPRDVLYHVEACLRLFTQEGDYENKGKARIRFIVKRLGREEFLVRYKKALEEVKASMSLKLPEVYEPSLTKAEEYQEDSIYPNMISQKQKGLYTVVIHPGGGILKSEDLNNITSFVQKVPEAELRLSMEESLYIRNLTLDQAKDLLKLAGSLAQTTAVERSISCIGVPTCQIGIGESQRLLGDILNYMEEHKMTEEILPSIHISGCLNSCARQQVSEIGFHCKKKQTEQNPEIYALHIGGRTSEFDTHLGTVYGDLTADNIPKFLYELAVQLKEKQLKLMEYIQLEGEEFQALVKQYSVC